jgi:TonB family C-terminal domain
MGALFAYSLQSAICIAAFYLFFKVLLSRDTFHRFNRIALLGILALSLIIPLILTAKKNIFISALNNDTINIVDDFDIFANTTSNSEVLNVETGNIYLSILLLIYLSGCVISLIYSMLSIGLIIKTIKKGDCIKNDSGIKIIISKNNNQSPFSWMNYIILSRNDYDEAGETIITHEKAHVRLHHTYDLIIAQACIIMQWFNPAAWLLYQELQNIHEYEADDKVLRQGIDAKQYQLLLIKKAVGTRLYSMANSFNHSNLKKRITMMLQKKSNSWARLKYAYVLPLAVILLAACTNKEVSKKMDEISNAKISNLASDSKENEVKNSSEAENNEPQSQSEIDDSFVFVSVEKMPQFPGGEVALLKWISENINYPEEAKKNKIEGRVACSFVVNKDGSVSDVQVVRPLDPDLDKEAVRVLSILPKFIPGEQRGEAVRVKYSVPVRFGKKPPSQETQSTQKTSESKTDPNDPTLYITVENMPEFPGGDVALLRWIGNNIDYPKEAIEERLQGRVSCTFVVEADGSITNVKVMKALNNILDTEAVRVLSTLPKFKPGTEKGVPVRVKYSVPVRFQIKE